MVGTIVRFEVRLYLVHYVYPFHSEELFPIHTYIDTRTKSMADGPFVF